MSQYTGMDSAADTAILILVILTAIGFDFTNGFHDTGNAMATSIATGALKPKVAVTLSAVLNLVGAFLSVKVALTVANHILKIQDNTGTLVPGLNHMTALTIIFAGLIGGILWNLMTWLLGIPSSSTHALFGGLIGSGLVASVTIDWNGILGKVLIPALLSPIIAGIVAAASTFVIYALTHRISRSLRDKGFGIGQTVSASLVSLAHGTSDAQKTMGIIAWAMVTTNHLDAANIKENGLPVWIIISCATAMGLGTFLGGWRVIRTLGKGLVEIDPPQGMAAEAASSAIILTSSSLGMALATTQVVTGAILGAGAGRPGAVVRWAVGGRMLVAWVLTLPAAAVAGGITYKIAQIIGGWQGAVVIFLILIAAAAAIYRQSRKTPITADNVNTDWDSQIAEAPQLTMFNNIPSYPPAHKTDFSSIESELDHEMVERIH